MFKPLRRSCLVLVLLATALAPQLAAAQEKIEVPSIVRELNQAFVQVAEQVSSAVVVIKVAHRPNFIDLDDQENPFWDMLPRQFRKQLEEQRQKQREESTTEREPVFDSQGSGVVIRKDGYIITNRHVVDGAEKIRVRFADGRDYPAEVRGVDAQSDIAVLKIEAKEDLAVARMGDSSKTRVGEFAIAIGAPFELDYSVTFGHISAKGRSHIIPDPSLDQDFIQTDANINPGNSGGPLVNIYGEVIGINTLIRGLRTGIGFAIPSDLAREVSEQLIANGKFVRAYLGIGIRALRNDAEYRLLSKVPDGVIVTEIRRDGPAKESQLRPSDIITAVDGRPVATEQQLKNEVRSKKIGEDVVLDVQRKDQKLKIKVKPGPWPEESTPVIARRDPVPEEGEKTLGVTVKSLTKELAEQYGLEETEGVIVTEVERRGPADNKGIRPGDIITEVNQQPITTPQEFIDAAKKARLSKGVIINFISRGTSKFVILKESGD